MNPYTNSGERQFERVCVREYNISTTSTHTQTRAYATKYCSSILINIQPELCALLLLRLPPYRSHHEAIWYSKWNRTMFKHLQIIKYVSGEFTVHNSVLPALHPQPYPNILWNINKQQQRQQQQRVQHTAPAIAAQQSAHISRLSIQTPHRCHPNLRQTVPFGLEKKKKKYEQSTHTYPV